MLEEFKKFALRGNVVDLAIGVDHRRRLRRDRQFAGRGHPDAGRSAPAPAGSISPTTFIPLSSKVTADSLVEAKKQGAVLAWGSFLTIVINFVIIAWVLFLVVKLMNRLMRSRGRQGAGRSPSRKSCSRKSAMC